MLQIEVFIQNEAGSNVKNHHDEKALTHKGTSVVSRRYPFPYGFVIGTTAHDGCNVDCFVITRTELRCGDRVDCLAIGLMEQTEDGVSDHNVIAVPIAGKTPLSDDFESALTEFVTHVFDHVPNKQIRVGRFLGPDEARRHILASLDRKPGNNAIERSLSG